MVISLNLVNWTQICQRETLSEISQGSFLSVTLPLLTRATAENDEPTPGYMLQEIEKITYESSPHCQQLVEYLNRRLEKPSAAVKLKVLKIMMHLIQHGDVQFRQYLRGNDSYIKLASMYSGMPDAQLGMTPYENVRKRSQELLEMLFSTESMQQDECRQQPTKNKLVLGGLGSVKMSGKYDGFGSAPVQKEETFRSRMMNMWDRLMNPTDETAEIIRSALSSSPGNYKPVNVPEVAAVNLPEPTTVPRRGRNSKAHVPGRAGGGWDSDSEHDDREGSNVSVDSLERVTPADDEPSVESAAVITFCTCQEWPLLPSHLRTECKRFAALNCMDVMRAIASLLTSSDCTTITALRALLVLEWFLRTDLVNVAATSRLIALPLRNIEASHFEAAAKAKAKKVRLILDKLNTH